MHRWPFALFPRKCDLHNTVSRTFVTGRQEAIEFLLHVRANFSDEHSVLQQMSFPWAETHLILSNSNCQFPISVCISGVRRVSAAKQTAQHKDWRGSRGRRELAKVIFGTRREEHRSWFCKNNVGRRTCNTFQRSLGSQKNAFPENDWKGENSFFVLGSFQHINLQKPRTATESWSVNAQPCKPLSIQVKPSQRKGTRGQIHYTSSLHWSPIPSTKIPTG